MKIHVLVNGMHFHKQGCANVGCKNGSDRLKSGSVDPYMG